jgi:hypothetical protein
MCRKQTLIGLPRVPPPRYEYACPIFALGKMTQVRKGKTMDTTDLRPGEVLHLDFAFWDIPSHRGFTAMLVAIDAKTRKLWLFCTASKNAPIHILWWLFSNLRREHKTLSWIHVEKYGALIGLSALCRFIRDNEALNLESTGGYASYLNGKIERLNRTIAERVRCCILKREPSQGLLVLRS